MTTAHMIELPNGMRVIEPNEAMNGDKFYVSYNNYDTSTYGQDTTALVWGQMQHFYILNGDHRQEYAKLIPQGFKACLRYFRQNPDKVNKYSENHRKVKEMFKRLRNKDK